MTAVSPFPLDEGEPFRHRDGVLHVAGLPVDRRALVVAGGEALVSRQRETWDDLLAWKSRLTRRLRVAAPMAHQPAGAGP